MNRLTTEQKVEMREMLEEDNKRIEHERFHGDITARRAKHLRPSALAARYGVTEGQIRHATKGVA